MMLHMFILCFGRLVISGSSLGFCVILSLDRMFFCSIYRAAKPVQVWNDSSVMTVVIGVMISSDK